MPPIQMYKVVVSYKDRQEQAEQYYGPLSLEAAERVVVAVCARQDVLRAYVVPVTS